MANRMGAKIGWLAGWLGGICWMPISATDDFIKGDTITGLIGLACFTLSLVSIFSFVPWRYPNARMWMLMLPIYFLTLGYIIALLAQQPNAAMLNWTTIFKLFPASIPLLILGSRRWKDLDPQTGTGPVAPSAHDP